MVDALLEISRTGNTSNQNIQAIWLAKIINIQSGGVWISPLDVDQLPEDWIELFIGIATELPEIENARDKVKQYRDKFRRNHPTYRKVK